MKKFIEKINHISASNAVSALSKRLTVGDMNEHTGRVSPISASIATSALASRVIASVMKKDTLKIRLVSANRLVRALAKQQMIKRSQARPRLKSQLLWSKTAAAKLKSTSVGFARKNLIVRHYSKNITMTIWRIINLVQSKKSLFKVLWE